MPRVQWYWISKRTGQRINLTGLEERIETPKGAAGHGAPPLEITYETIPGIAGQTITQIKHGTNELRLPIFVRGSDFNDLENRLRGLIRQFDGLNGQGILGCINTNGRVSELECIVTEGLRMDQAQLKGNAAVQFELTFQAPYPYWRGEQITQSFVGGTGVNWFPILPLSLGESSLLGETDINVDSDVETYPIWTIHGPGDNPRLTNTVNGVTKVFAMNYHLNAGETITVDTTIGRARVYADDGSTRLQFVTSRSLWTLQPDINHINLELQNASTDSYVSLAYRGLRLSP